MKLSGINSKKLLKNLLAVTLAFIIVIPVIPQLSAQVYAASTYFVSTTGSDITGNGSINNPWRTIQKAASVMKAGDTCYIRGGIYRETVTPANSGTSANKIRFEAYQGEDVIVSGCDLITNWTQHSGSIYKAAMNWDMAGGNIVFVDNILANEAKWPNNTDNGILDVNSWATVDSATTGTVNTITDSALSSFSDGYWDGATVVCISGVAYTAYSSTISSFTSSTLTFTPFAGGTSWYQPESNDLYYITNSLKALDTPLEWYKDSSTGTLYLWAPGGDSPNNHMVEAKKREYAFDLTNKSYIEIIGVNMRAASVKTTGAEYCKIIGIRMQGAQQNIEGSYNEIRNSEISNSYTSGIHITGDHNYVINNYIHDVDFIASNKHAGIILNGSGHLISHNTVCRGASGMLMGTFDSSVIQYNNIYDACMLTEDIGIVYLGNGDYGNSEFHHNWIHDNKSRSIPNAGGFYTDNYTSNIIFYKNVLWNTPFNQFMLNAPYNFNLFYNNTTYNKSNLGSQYMENTYGSQFMNNIVTDGIICPPEVILSNNMLGGNPLFVNASSGDFRIQSASPAKDAGTVIPGVTDDFIGTAPDIGAYEFGGDYWIPGHNFSSPPDPVYSLNNSIVYKNRVSNAGFEFGGTEENHGSLQSWTTTGTPQAIYCNTWDYGAASLARMNFNSALLKNGDKLEQTITGLNPNTTYVLSAWGMIGGKRIEAEDYSSGFGSSHWDAPETVFRGNKYIGPLRDGDYVCYNNITFNNLYNRFAAGVVNTKAGGSIEIRLDSTTGTLLGTINLSDYNGGWKFEEISISPVSGTHDLYLVFRGTGDIGLLDSIILKNTSMADSIKLGVKNYGGSDIYTDITSTSWTNEFLLFTTGSSSTSATIYIEKPSGNYFGYVDNIGLVKSYLPEGAIFYDSFETGFGNWNVMGGNPSTSPVQKRSGGLSYVLNQDVDAIVHEMPSNTNKVAVVWFYDDISASTVEAMAFVDNSNIPISVAIGADTNISSNKYVYRIGNDYNETPITRTTGWHEFVFDYTSGTDVKLYIDGVQVGSTTAVTSFNRIYLGDAWGSGYSNSVYFDDVCVRNTLPFSFYDGFESGFGNWNTMGGTPTVSTVQKHSGSYSYVLNEDVDSIMYELPTYTNKVAVVWFYDDAADSTLESMAFVDPTVQSIAMGVDTRESANKYVYWVGSTYYETSVNRSTGWHQLTFDYTSGSDVRLYIDGIQVAVSTSASAFNRIYLGDGWNSGYSGTVYFDDICIRDYLPFAPTTFFDSFENGFNNWTTIGGTPGTSMTQSYSGAQSFVVDEDMDAIQCLLPTSYNKVAVVWFYDDASDTSLEAVAVVDDYNTGVFIGVDTSHSATNYVGRIGSTYFTSSVARSTGWHKFVFDYRSGNDVKLYVDDTYLASSTEVTSFYRILVGDLWNSGTTGMVYFDNVTVQDNLP